MTEPQERTEPSSRQERHSRRYIASLLRLRERTKETRDSSRRRLYLHALVAFLLVAIGTLPPWHHYPWLRYLALLFGGMLLGMLRILIPAHLNLDLARRILDWQAVEREAERVGPRTSGSD